MSGCCPHCQGESGVFQQRYATYQQYVFWDGGYDASDLTFISGRPSPIKWRCIDCKKVIKNPPEMGDTPKGDRA